MAKINKTKMSRLTPNQLAVLERGDLQEILEDSEILSCFSGRLGPYVIRQQNGKPVVSRRAESFKASQSDKAVYFRNKFAAAQRFAGFINNIDILAELWEDPNTRAYNKIMKQNVVACDEFWPTDNNIITPREFHFKIEEAEIVNDFLTLKMNESYALNESDVLKVLLMVYDPVYEDDRKFEMIDVNPQYSVFGMQINLTDEQLLTVLKYRKSIHYIAVIRKNGSEMTWSNTIAICR